MQDYVITIEELISKDFVIKAETREDAVEKAIELYRQGDLVLCPGNIEMKRISMPDNYEEWIEF